MKSLVWILLFKSLNQDLRTVGGPEEGEWMMYARDVRNREVSFDSDMILQRINQANQGESNHLAPGLHKQAPFADASCQFA